MRHELNFGSTMDCEACNSEQQSEIWVTWNRSQHAYKRHEQATCLNCGHVTVHECWLSQEFVDYCVAANEKRKENTA